MTILKVSQWSSQKSTVATLGMNLLIHGKPFSARSMQRIALPLVSVASLALMSVSHAASKETP